MPLTSLGLKLFDLAAPSRENEDPDLLQTVVYLADGQGERVGVAGQVEFVGQTPGRLEVRGTGRTAGPQVFES